MICNGTGDEERYSAIGKENLRVGERNCGQLGVGRGHRSLAEQSGSSSSPLTTHSPVLGPLGAAQLKHTPRFHSTGSVDDGAASGWMNPLRLRVFYPAFTPPSPHPMLRHSLQRKCHSFSRHFSSLPTSVSDAAKGEEATYSLKEIARRKRKTEWKRRQGVSLVQSYFTNLVSLPSHFSP